MTIETLIVKEDFTTLDILLWRRFGREIRGAVDATLTINQDLAEQGPYLAVGTNVDIEIPDVKAEPVVKIVRLW